MPANFSAPVVHYWAGAYPGCIGWLIGPAAALKTCVRSWLPYALDNDAFQAFSRGVPWDEAAFLALLAWAKRQIIPPRWVIVPDVVADADATLRNWLRYAGVVAAFGWPLAFAVQDGMTPTDVPSNAEVVFVGGSTAWKWRTVPLWARSFSRVHVGRVNTLDRLWLCHDLGIESVDGTDWLRMGQTGPQIEALGRFFAGERSPQGELFTKEAE